MTLRRRIAGLLARAAAAASTASTASTASSEPATAAARPDEVGAHYAPEIDGEPDPGEVVWAWVAYEDDPSQGKDRPVLILAADPDGAGWTGLMLSSQDHDRDAADEARHGRHWMDVGSGGWDSQGRPSEVRLDRVLHLERDGVRREGAALDERIFADVVAAVRGLGR